MESTTPGRRPPTRPPFRIRMEQIAIVPAWAILLMAYLGTLMFTVVLSFTSSRGFPQFDFVGLSQYRRLMATPRWSVSVENLLVFGTGFIICCLVFGFLLAVVMDSRIRGEGFLRTVFLYPHSMSFVVTGLAWQWMFNPALGIQSTVRGWGWETFTLNWLTRPDLAIYVMIIAGAWQSTGLISVILLAGLRGVDADIWKATKVDGVPTWQVYLRIVLPMIRPMVAVSVIMLAISVVKAYDLVVALTNGGPGMSTELPAKFAMDSLFTRQNIGLASASITLILVSVVAIVGPWMYCEARKARNSGGH